MYPVSLEDLTSNGSESMNLGFNYFDAQIMQVIVTSVGNGTNSAYVYVNQESNRNDVNNIHYY